jgi:hypothetical protein
VKMITDEETHCGFSLDATIVCLTLWYPEPRLPHRGNAGGGWDESAFPGRAQIRDTRLTHPPQTRVSAEVLEPRMESPSE